MKENDASDPPPADHPERKTNPMSSGIAGSPLTLQNPGQSSERPNFSSSPQSSLGTGTTPNSGRGPNIWMPDSPDQAHPQKSTSSPLTGGLGPLNTVKRFMHASNNSIGSSGLGSVKKDGTGPPQSSTSKIFGTSPKHRIGGSIEMSNMSNLTKRRGHHPMHSRDLSAQLFINLTDEVEQQQNEFPDKPYYRELNTEIPWYLNVRQSRWTLRFCEKEAQPPRADPRRNEHDDRRANHYASVENWFNTDRFKKSRRLVRGVCLILVLVVVAQILSDNCSLWESSLCIRARDKFKNRQFILWFFTLPLTLLWFWSSFQDFYMNNLNWVPPIFALGWGISYTLVTAVAEKADNASMMTYLFCVWMFLRIPFCTAFLVTWPVVIGFLLVIRLTEVYPKAYPSSDEFDPLIEEGLDALYLFATNAFLTYAAYSLERTERSEFIDTLEKDHTKQNTQDLLNNLIPQEIQVRIREQMGGVDGKEEAMRQLGRGAIADERSDVSVLFSDLVGFTKYCSSVHATAVVRALNSLYFQFDSALEKLNVFKVETIGDAYFVSSNCPIPSEDHAERLVLLGERMIEACASFVPGGTADKDYKFRMRIGVHSGKVYAGVVGYKMPRYHLFGKTVTIAEQMESSGVPGKVQISEDTKVYLDKWKEQSKRRMKFGFQRRDEPIEVAGGQKMNTYLIVFRSPASRRRTNTGTRTSVPKDSRVRRKDKAGGN